MARINVDQYHRMLEVGILREGDPIELLNGLLICKDRSTRGESGMTTGKGHSVAVQLLLDLNAQLALYGLHIRIQNPVTLPPEDEPEPDGAIVRGKQRDYLGGHPSSADVTCIIEVADSSLDHDRTNKLAVYARAGIPQYLIVNLLDGRVEVFEQPVAAESRYVRADVIGKEGRIGLLLGGDARLDVPARKLLP